MCPGNKMFVLILQWRQSPRRRCLRRQSLQLAWDLTSRLLLKQPTASRARPRLAPLPPPTSPSTSGRCSFHFIHSFFHVFQADKVRAQNSSCGVNKIISCWRFCRFKGVPFHLWSAYLAGLPWQACCHWTGKSRAATRPCLRLCDIHGNKISHVKRFFCSFTGNICRNSDRAGPVKLLRVKVEEALLSARVRRNNYISYGASWLFDS